MLFFLTPVFVRGAVLSAKVHFVNLRLAKGTTSNKQCQWIQFFSSPCRKVANTGSFVVGIGVFQMPFECVIYLFNLEVVDARLP